MRYKISFQKTDDQHASLPIHHQHLLALWLEPILDGLGAEKERITFSSLKGTTRILNGNIRFLSSKISMSVSSNDPSVAETLMSKILEQKVLDLGTLKMTAQKSEPVNTPAFTTKMKFVCISPLILKTAAGGPEEPQPVNPSSTVFSDEIFHSLMDRMEKAGYSAKQLDDYQVFGIMPDKEYLAKAESTQRKIARLYKDTQGTEHLGYLFPFTLHAHPDVQRFVWDCGIGVLNGSGYGMIDLASAQ